MHNNKLTKSQVCHLFNVSKEFLRHYENKGLLSPEVDEKKYRFYGHKDLNQIRRLLLLRDLDFTVKDIQKINKVSINKVDFQHMLKNQQQSMTKKLKHLQETLNDVTQWLNLLERDEPLSFLIKSYPNRYFTLIESTHEDLNTFYKKFKASIEEETYSEKSFQMIYDFDALETGHAFEGKMAIETNQHHGNEILCEGDYLSVFFPFQEDNFIKLKEVTREINDYLLVNRLIRVNQKILEKEHPELSMFLDENTSIFELQIKIERKNNVIF